MEYRKAGIADRDRFTERLLRGVHHVMPRTPVRLAQRAKPCVTASELNVESTREELAALCFNRCEIAGAIGDAKFLLARGERARMQTIGIQNIRLAEMREAEQCVHAHPIVVVFETETLLGVIAHQPRSTNDRENSRR